MPAYLRFYEKPDKPAPIKGSSKAKGYEGWIELTSVQQVVSRSIGTTIGREANGRTTNEMVVTKALDEASAALMRAGSSGFNSAMIAVIVMVSPEGKKFMTYNLQNVLVSGYSISSGGDTPSEAVTLNFEKATFTMSPTSSDVTRSAVYQLNQQSYGP